MNLLLMLSLALYAVMSVVTFAAYGIDKRRAIRGKPRVRERTLHLFALVGGWPGGVLGQSVFRHKRQKVSFMLVFGGIVVLHIAGWIACWRMGWLF